ncbi:MAG: thiamine pyrophosphate-binding protein [Candidatus Pacearchaeota archaeon]
MIKRINISNEDKEKILNHECPKDPCLSKVDFRNTVVNKPWGYEYLMFQTPEVSIWMLYIKKGYSTSVHCHPNKKTSLLIINGEAECSTLKEKFKLKEKDALILDKGVFHTTEALSENGIFLMEIETPSDKTDLFRLTDKYKRENKAYTDTKNITNKIYNYNYLYLNEKNKNSTNILGKYKFIIRTFKKNDNIKKQISKLGVDIGIVLDGDIKTPNKTIEQGDVLDREDLKNLDIKSPTKLLLIHERKNLIRLSDYVISFLQNKGINDVFLISGGNIMYLLESIRIKKMNYIANHHEQASSMCADSYARTKNDIGFCMVTSGPGGTNAITGVAGAWIDSIPLLVISGQSYSTQTIGNSGLRQLGVQEINIIDIVRPITKYAVMVKDPKKIRYHLEKALYIAKSGRPGPVWLDIPVNIQLTKIQEEELEPFIPPKEIKKNNEKIKEYVKKTIELIKNSKRPVILLGNGVRLSHAEKEFFKMADILSIPILTSRNANDLIWEDHPLYAGRPGSFGQRFANYTIQNSDLLLSIGSRISLALTGWAFNDFAREAKKIVVDIDKAELNKNTVKPDIAINADAKDFILEMLSQLKGYKPNDITEWKNRIKYWKEKYPICLPEYKDTKNYVNTYYFIDVLSDELKEDDIIVTDMGMSFQCTMQGLRLKKGQRLFTESGLAAMGYGLPAAIGACIANNRKRIICITGDGGLQMNVQELQTVFHNKLPIKIFVFNNKGYSSQRETQRAYFEGYTASEPGSGVSTPDFSKVAAAYGLKSKRVENQNNLIEDIREALNYEGAYLIDLNISEEQIVKPKQGAFNRPDGKTVPRPIEDMIPYVDREELKKDMIIDPIPFDPYKE